MAEKEFNTRIVHKHDIQANWEKAVGFIPKQGELIVYDIDENYDYQRIKIGDGVTKVNVLPFWDKGIEDKLIENAPNLEADRGEPGYIANRPGYRTINKDVNTTIELVEVGSYCLLDFSTVNEDFVNNYLTYEELIRDYSRLYDFYYSYDRVVVETGSVRLTSLERVGDKIKLLDDINCYTSIGRSALFYIIHNRDLLSEELKEKIPYNGIWLISTESINPQGSQMRNFWFREYRYTKFDPNLIPDNVMFKRDMGEYVTQEEIDGAIADLHAIQYTEQSLTEEQQMQARKNLGLYNTTNEILFSDYVEFIDQKATKYGMIDPNMVEDGDAIKVETGSFEFFGTIEKVQTGPWSFDISATLKTSNSSDTLYITSSGLEQHGAHVLSGEQYVVISKNKITKIPEEYLENIVQYTGQALTYEQKAQARANIDAAGAAMIVARDYSTQTTVDGVTKIKADHTFEEIKAWHDADGIVLFRSSALMPVYSISSSKIIFAGISWAGEDPHFTKITIDTDSYVTTDNADKIPVPDVGAVGQVMAVKSITSSGKPNAWEPIDLPTQIQADWSQTDETAPDFIKNKPEILVECSDEEIKALFSV